MAYIFLRGKEEGLEVDNGAARLAKLTWERCVQTKRHEPVEIGSLSILTSEIKGIQLDGEERKDLENENFEKYIAWRNEFKNLSPAEKAEKSYQHFLLAFYVYTGKKEVDEKQREYVLKILQEFFEKHPSWCIPSLKIYEPIFKKAGIHEILGQKEDIIFMAGKQLLDFTEINELNFGVERLKNET